MFKDFDISSFKKQKPPSNNSFDTAQEIKALVPEIVTPNADENNGWYALDDGKLMAVVVKAIQELKAEIDALKG